MSVVGMGGAFKDFLMLQRMFVSKDATHRAAARTLNAFC